MRAGVSSFSVRLLVYNSYSINVGEFSVNHVCKVFFELWPEEYVWNDRRFEGYRTNCVFVECACTLTLFTGVSGFSATLTAFNFSRSSAVVTDWCSRPVTVITVVGHLHIGFLSVSYDLQFGVDFPLHFLVFQCS